MRRSKTDRKIFCLACLVLLSQQLNADDSVSKRTADQISNKRVSFIYSEVSLADAMVSLSKQTGVRIEFDQYGLDIAKATKDAMVSGEANRDTLGKALDELLAPLNLTYLVRSGAILITDREETGAKRVTKLYPVADLLAPSKDQTNAIPSDRPKTTSVDPSALDAFADIIRANVSANFQIRVRTSPSNGALVIAGDHASHDIVEKLLDTLRSHQRLMSQQPTD